MSIQKYCFLLVLVALVKVSLSAPPLPSDYKEPKDRFVHEDCNKFYIAKSGDYLWKITVSHGLIWREMLELNPIPRHGNYDKLEEGDRICIGRLGMIPPSEENREYKVIDIHEEKKGCVEIAFENHLTFIGLLILNPTISCHKNIPKIHKIVVSRGLPHDCIDKYHVRYTDTSDSIAESNGLTSDELQILNPGIHLDTLYPESILCLARPLYVPKPEHSHHGTTPTRPHPVEPVYPQGHPNHISPVDPHFHPLCNAYYDVQPRDTIWNIAIRRGLIRKEIELLNPTPRRGTYIFIQPGDRICIGRYGMIPPSQPDGAYKTIDIRGKSKTCTQIIDENHLTEEHLILLNPEISCHEDIPKICEVVVSRGLHPDCIHKYDVQIGDTSNGIAAKHGLTTTKLQSFNRGINLEKIYAESILCVKLK